MRPAKVLPTAARRGRGGAATGTVSVCPMRISARASRPLAATIAATVVPCLAAMAVTVSPDRTVCVTEPAACAAAAGAGAAAAAAAAPGIVSVWPIADERAGVEPVRRDDRLRRWCRSFAAMRPTVSPDATV